MIQRYRNTYPSWAQGFARDPSDIADAELRAMRQSCIGLWVPGLGATGATLYDVSGRGNHGALTAMEPATDWQASSFGSVLDFDGTNDYVSVADPNESLTTLTVSCWAKTSAVDNKAFVAHFESVSPTNNRSWMFGVSNDNWTGSLGAAAGTELAVYCSTDGTSSASKVKTHWLSGSNISDGVWHHLAFTWNNGSLTLYIDGQTGTVDWAQNGTFTSLFNTATALTIGGFMPSGIYSTACQIGTVQIASRAFSSSSIHRLSFDPYALVRKTRTWLPVAVTGGTPATTIRHPWQHRRHRRLSGVC